MKDFSRQLYKTRLILLAVLLTVIGLGLLLLAHWAAGERIGHGCKSCPSVISVQEGEESPRKKFENWVRSCRKGAAMSGAAAVAKANRLMRIDLNDCDSNPMRVNCRNGVVDAATMQFYQYEPDQLLTMKSGVSYNPNAICPAWGAFFEEV